MADEIFIGTTIEEGEKLLDWCHKMLQDGKPKKFTCVNTQKRSLSQNSLYWKWLSEISTQIRTRTGQNHDTEVLHEYFKQMYCPQKKASLSGRELIFASTKKLDKGEMHFYLNQIEVWGVDRGFKLTIPDDSEYQKLKQESES